MKSGINILIVLTLIVMVGGCKKALEKRDLTALNGELVFNDSVLSRTYVDYIYDQNLPAWGGTNGLNNALSEETAATSNYFLGTLQVSDVSDFGTGLSATNNYGKIRTINQFLTEIDKGTLSSSWKNTLKAQALFFRAFRYFELVKQYGGVPMVLEPQQAVGDAAKAEAFLPRNKTSECITQIVKDLDKAISILPGKWSDPAANWGRITSGAAAAFKGRVLQYWASPQFNPGDLSERWQSAYDAGKAAKTTLMASGFGLHASYDKMWFSEQNNPEAIMTTGFNNLTADQTRKNNGYDGSTRPTMFGTGSGSNQPTKEMIDAYPMRDGKKISDLSSKYTYNPQLFYKNRDPRFDKTIAYNGTSWTLYGTAYTRFWYYLEGTAITAGPGGNKVPNSSGFFVKKAIDTTVATGNVAYIGTDWMEIRYAEVILNLAEAATGINKLDEAYTELKAIRARAGLEAGTDGLYGLKAGMTRAEMFKAILDERMVEFAFEGKRYWDLRRWKLFESTLNGKKRTGITVTFKPSATITTAAQFAQQRDILTLDDAYTNNFTIASKVLDTYFPNGIGWKPEYYFFALPQAAIDNNPKLVQNVGWGGTFDPLQ